MKLDDPLLADMAEGDKKATLRYGVVEYEDMLRDLNHWETLLTSSFMQRPHDVLCQPAENEAALQEAQERNLASALAFAALTCESGEEADLYETIVEIPHYQQKYMQLLDKEDEIGVVEDNFEKFQQMYHPVWQNKFREVLDLSGGKFQVDRSPAARRLLAEHVNDNVYKNIEKFSVLLFDDEQKRHKKEFTAREKDLVIERLLEDESPKEHLDAGVDRILLCHRNTWLFLFMMTGPFLVIFQTVKYIIKYGSLYYIYKRGVSKTPDRDAQ